MSPQLLVLAGVLALAGLVGVFYRRRSGVLRATPPSGRGSGERLTAVDLGAPLGARATLVHFSSAFCQPCRATRRVLGTVAGMVDGVSHVEIDAEANLDLVRRLGIMRTPTVLVLDTDGIIAGRAAGQPRTADVIAAVGAITHDPGSWTRS